MATAPAHQRYDQHFPRFHHAIVNPQNEEPSEPMVLQEPSDDTANVLSLPPIFSRIEIVIAQIETVRRENATLRDKILSLEENNRALEQKVYELAIKARNASPVPRPLTFYMYVRPQPRISFHHGISNSNLANTYIRQGKYSLDRSDYSGALMDMEHALSVDGNCADAHAYKAFAYMKIGERTKSLEAAEKALLIMPNHSIAQQCKAIVSNSCANSWNEIIVPQR